MPAAAAEVLEDTKYKLGLEIIKQVTGAEIKENPGPEDLKVLSAAMGRFCENGKLNAFTYQPPGREKQAVSRKISMAELIEKEQKKNRLPEQRKKNLPEERKTVQKNSNSRTAEELQRKSYVPTA